MAREIDKRKAIVVAVSEGCLMLLSSKWKGNS